jgi:CRP-like cAMP-binding protein
MSIEADDVKRLILQKADFFRDLAEDEITAIIRIMAPKKFPSGAVIMREGDQGDTLYMMAAGRVEVNKTLTMKFGQDDYRETEKTLTILSADTHAVFGEMALITEDQRSATITALSDCMLYEISRADFLRLAADRPSLGFKVTLRIAALLSHRLKKSGEDVVRLTTALSIALSQ